MGLNLDKLDDTEFLNFEDLEFCPSFALSVMGCWRDYYTVSGAGELAKRLFMHYALGLAILYDTEREDWRETYNHQLMLKAIWAINDENQDELNKVIREMDTKQVER